MPRQERLPVHQGAAGEDLRLLFEAIIDTIPAPQGDKDGPFANLVANLDYSDYLGRLAIARVFSGTMKTGEDVAIAKRDGSFQKTKITKLFSFSGLKRTDITGNIARRHHCRGRRGRHHDGETITSAENPRRFRPSLLMSLRLRCCSPSTHPRFADAKAATLLLATCASGLIKSCSPMVSLRMEETGSTDSFKVLGPPASCSFHSDRD